MRNADLGHSEIRKTCSCCGHVFTEIPESARVQTLSDDEILGYFFDCTCGTTVFIKIIEETVWKNLLKRYSER